MSENVDFSVNFWQLLYCFVYVILTSHNNVQFFIFVMGREEMLETASFLLSWVGLCICSGKQIHSTPDYWSCVMAANSYQMLIDWAGKFFLLISSFFIFFCIFLPLVLVPSYLFIFFFLFSFKRKENSLRALNRCLKFLQATVFLSVLNRWISP